MAWTKAKVAVVVGTGVLLTAGTVIVISILSNDPPANPVIARQILQGAFTRISAPLPAQMKFVADMEEIPRPYTEAQAREEAKKIQGVFGAQPTNATLATQQLAKLPPTVRQRRLQQEAKRKQQEAELIDLQTETVLWAHQPRTYREQEWFSDGQWRLDQLETTPKPEKLQAAERPLPEGLAYERVMFMLAATNPPDERSMQIDHRLQSVWYSKTHWAQSSFWQAGTLEPMIGFMLTMTLSDLHEVAEIAKTKSKTEQETDSFGEVKLDAAKLETLVNGKSLLWKVQTDEVTENGRKLAVLRLKGRKAGLAHGADITFFADAANPANIYRIEVTAMPSLLPLQSAPYISTRDAFDTNGFPHTWIVETPNDKRTTKRTVKFVEVEFPAKFDDAAVFHPEIPAGYQVNGRAARQPQ